VIRRLKAGLRLKDLPQLRFELSLRPLISCRKQVRIREHRLPAHLLVRRQTHAAVFAGRAVGVDQRLQIGVSREAELSTQPLLDGIDVGLARLATNGALGQLAQIRARVARHARDRDGRGQHDHLHGAAMRIKIGVTPVVGVILKGPDTRYNRRLPAGLVQSRPAAVVGGSDGDRAGRRRSSERIDRFERDRVRVVRAVMLVGERAGGDLRLSDLGHVDYDSSAVEFQRAVRGQGRREEMRQVGVGALNGGLENTFPI
jgi:hypothetical protein